MIAFDAQAMKDRMDKANLSGSGDPTENNLPNAVVGAFYVDTSKSPSPIWRKTKDGWINTRRFKEV